MALCQGSGKLPVVQKERRCGGGDIDDCRAVDGTVGSVVLVVVVTSFCQGCLGGFLRFLGGRRPFCLDRLGGGRRSSLSLDGSSDCSLLVTAVNRVFVWDDVTIIWEGINPA